MDAIDKMLSLCIPMSNRLQKYVQSNVSDWSSRRWDDGLDLALSCKNILNPKIHQIGD